MYAPEKARATFLRSRAHRRMKDPDKAKADATSAATQYLEITGRGAAEVDEGFEAKQGDFDSLVAFWSR